MIEKIKNFFLKRKFRDEYSVLELLKRKFPTIEVVLEAGGHNGKDTLRIHKAWPKAKILVFEPEPELFEQLRVRVATTPNILLSKLALSDCSGVLKFHKSSGRSDASGSLMKPKEHLTAHPDVHFDEQIEVQVTDLDSWCLKNNIKKIDFMWLDMQGHEYNMLKGCPNMLKYTKIIYSEVSLIETYEGVPLYPEFREFMESNGFEVFQEYLNWKDMGNVLFIRKEFIY